MFGDWLAMLQQGLGNKRRLAGMACVFVLF